MTVHKECSTKEQKVGRRARRSFAPEYKAEAVRWVNGGKPAGQVAKDLDLTETALREWVKRAEAHAGTGSPDVLTAEERQELARLRRVNKTLRMEREVLKAAAPPSSRGRAGEVRVHRRVDGGLSRDPDVPCPRHLDQRLLRLEGRAGVQARAA